jgi:hypothetical protein
MRPFSGPESVNRTSRFREPQLPFFPGFIAIQILENSLWGPACGPALLGDHLGSLKADQAPGSRVSQADDQGHGRARAAPAHHWVAHSQGVFSRYATQLLDIPVAWAN